MTDRDFIPLEYRTAAPSQRWITVATFDNAAIANVARQKIEEEGIPAYLDNENTATTLWHLQPVVGGVKLRVPEQYRDQAQDVLEEMVTPEDGEDTILFEPAEADEEEEIAVRCPFCHGKDVVPITWGYRAMQAIIIVLLSVSLTIVHPWMMVAGMAYATWFFLSKPEYRCLHCRRRWGP